MNADEGTRSDEVAVRRVIMLGDVDEPVDSALRWASELADKASARMVLLVPDEIDSAEKVPGERADEVARTGADARGWLERIGVEVDVIAVAVDDRDRKLNDDTDEHDVVVIGTGDVVGVTRFALGAEPHGLARQLACPVVAVPSSWDTGDGPVVVGLGGHGADERSVAWAVSIGTMLGREVVAVHATDPMYETFDAAGDRGEDEEEARSTAERWGLGLREEPGVAGDVLTEVAAELGANLVVVAAKHRAALGGRLLGKVADSLLHEPPCPVAVVTHDYEQAA